MNKRQNILEGKLEIMSYDEIDEWINDEMPTNVVSFPNPKAMGMKDSLCVGLVTNPEIKAWRAKNGLE